MFDGMIVKSDTSLMLPDKVKGSVNAVCRIISDTEILNDSEYEKSGNVLNTIATIRKSVNDFFNPEVEARNKAHKESTTARREYLDVIVEAEISWKKKIIAYKKVMTDRVALAQKEADDKARREQEDHKISLAVELEKKGDTAQAEAVMDDKTEPVIVSPKIEAPKAAGVATSVKWDADVTDMRALVVAVAAGNAPISLLSVDRTAVRDFAKSTQGGMTVPGLRFFSYDTIGRVGNRAK